MGRPWWYDDYWKKEQSPAKGRLRLPKRPLWIWIAILALSAILATVNTGFQPLLLVWIVRFIYYFCRILVFIIFIRAVLSWSAIARTHLVMVLLDAIVEPILSPLRRVIPKIGLFDITPLVAILILYLIPFALSLLI